MDATTLPSVDWSNTTCRVCEGENELVRTFDLAKYTRNTYRCKSCRSLQHVMQVLGQPEVLVYRDGDGNRVAERVNPV